MSVIKNLYLTYDDFKIEIPEMEVLDQGITVLWGASGSGKTTIVRALLGLESCPGLSWIFNDVDLAQLPVSQRKLSVVFQNYELFPHMTVYENVYFAGQARGLQKSEIEDEIKNLATSLNATSFLNRLVPVISGGEKQRTALMRALIGRPRFLFLDEPFSALDKNLRQEARLLVKKTLAKHNIPALLITHDEEDVQVLANKTLHIEQGHLV